MDEYSEMVAVAKPVIYITVGELINTHKVRTYEGHCKFYFLCSHLLDFLLHFLPLLCIPLLVQLPSSSPFFIFFSKEGNNVDSAGLFNCKPHIFSTPPSGVKGVVLLLAGHPSLSLCTLLCPLTHLLHCPAPA